MPKRRFNAIVGIDEVARCPVVGSLVMAAVAVPEDFDFNRFQKIGVRDSKLLNRGEILDISRKLYLMRDIMCKYRMISATEISESENLNTLEARYAATLIKAVKDCATVKEVYIDSCDRDGNTYKERLKRFLKLNESHVKYVIETKADENYLVVSAASIIAKYISDAELDKLRASYDLGSGNPNDPKTLAFLLKHIIAGTTHECIRTNWITYRRLAEALKTGTTEDPRVKIVLWQYIQHLHATGNVSEAKMLQDRFVELLSIGGQKHGLV